MKILLIVLALFIASCTKIVEVEKIVEQKSTFTGTFPTADIRVMWQSCLQGHQVARRLPYQVAGAVCDCVADKTRQDFNMSDIKDIYEVDATGKQKGVNKDNQTRTDMVTYWTEANMVCEIQITTEMQGKVQDTTVDPKKML